MSGVQVRSPNLRSVRYDADKKLLEVELHTRDRYQFFDVPAAVYEQLQSADSREQFFDRNIRLKYRHRRIFQI
ncbi:MAG: KTSC domain-containing protein [Negativicutes bacterium]|nr:KTSC domain-containing protein [Negativicutes bacterium]